MKEAPFGASSRGTDWSLYSTPVAFAQDALDHDALDQDALDQEALDQEALDQDALDQDAFAIAALDQLAASNTLSPVPDSVVTYWLRAAFGFGGELVPTSPSASRTPTPSPPNAL